MQTESRPWYKEPYVWMLIGIPLSSVIMGVFFISQAVSTKDTLVRDNYYKDGLAINQEMQWDKKAENLDVQLEFTIANNEVNLTLLNSRQVAPNVLQFKLSHATLKDLDRDSLLQLGEDNRYKGFIENMSDGKYYIMVESLEQQWRRRGSIQIKQGDQVHSL